MWDFISDCMREREKINTKMTSTGDALMFHSGTRWVRSVLRTAISAMELVCWSASTVSERGGQQMNGFRVGLFQSGTSGGSCGAAGERGRRSPADSMVEGRGAPRLLLFRRGDSWPQPASLRSAASPFQQRGSPTFGPPQLRSSLQRRARVPRQDPGACKQLEKSCSRAESGSAAPGWRSSDFLLLTGTNASFWRARPSQVGWYLALVRFYNGKSIYTPRINPGIRWSEAWPRCNEVEMDLGQTRL